MHIKPYTLDTRKVFCDVPDGTVFRITTINGEWYMKTAECTEHNAVCNSVNLRSGRHSFLSAGVKVYLPAVALVETPTIEETA